MYIGFSLSVLNVRCDQVAENDSAEHRYGLPIPRPVTTYLRGQQSLTVAAARSPATPAVTGPMAVTCGRLHGRCPPTGRPAPSVAQTNRVACHGQWHWPKVTTQRQPPTVTVTCRDTRGGAAGGDDIGDAVFAGDQGGVGGGSVLVVDNRRDRDPQPLDQGASDRPNGQLLQALPVGPSVVEGFGE